MQKINTADGLFVDGNPSNGALGTVLTAAWLNMVQAELISVLTASGIAVDSSKSDQLTTAIQTLLRGKATVNVAGGVSVNLTAAQYGMRILILTGALTANINLIFPAISGAWIVCNQTTGNFSVTCKTAAGTGVVVSQGSSNALFGDSTNIYAEQTDWANIALTGTPTAPTAPAGTSTTQLANTAFVQAAVLAASVLPAGIPLDWVGLTPPSWAVVRDGSALTRTSYSKLFAALCPTRSGTLTNGSAAVTGLSTTLDMWVGMPVEGAGVPAGTTVASITSTSAITLSANATASGAQTLTLFLFGYGSSGSATTFGVPDDRGLHVRAYDSGRGYEQSTLTANTTNASNVLSSISSTRGLYVGMPVSGTGIPANAAIASITGSTTATMSANATATGTAAALTVTGRQVGAEGGDAIQNLTGTMTTQSALTAPTGAFYTYTASDGGYNGSGTGPDGLGFDASRVARAGPETQVKRRTYLPIITIGA